MIILILVFLIFISLGAFIILKKKMQYWVFSYAKSFFVNKKRFDKREPVDIMFCVADHFEPSFRAKEPATQKKRLERWLKEYPKLIESHKDFDGQKPKHTWFFPPHDDCNGNLESLAALSQQGLGEIEFHLHHDHIEPFPDSSQTLEKKIRDAINRYAQLGIFGEDKSDNQRKFGFVHGDWALDNSRGGRFCGVDNELQILAKCGCYADFTFPSICESQPRKINSLYYAVDDPHKPKSYNTGTDVEVGKQPKDDLMMIQGPLGLRIKKIGKFPFPAIEAATISKTDLPTPQRVDFWVNSAIGVKGKPNWVFIKVHTHGALEANADILLGEAMEKMYTYLERNYNDGKKFRLHYVTAREMYNIIKAAEAEQGRNPSQFRNYIIAKPLVCKEAKNESTVSF